MATQIAPTKGNLIATKKSYDLAKLGFELLDRKRNILIREMMALIDRAEEIQNKIDTVYTKAFSTLKKANIALGVCEQLAQVVPEEKGIDISFKSVMGVEIPIINFKENKIKNIPFGLYDSNSDLDKAYSCFREVRVLTANLAEVETSVYLLAKDIKKTQKRANALKNIMIPRFEGMIKSISDVWKKKNARNFLGLKL